MPVSPFVDASGNPIGRVTLHDVNGNAYSASGTPTASVLLNQASTSPTASGTTAGFATTSVGAVAVDVNLTAVTGGTAPTVAFFLDRQGADGVWYRVWTSAAQSAAATVSTSIGLGGPTNAALTQTARLGWTFGGTVNPTSVTFTASVVGR